MIYVKYWNQNNNFIYKKIIFISQKNSPEMQDFNILQLWLPANQFAWIFF